MIVVREVFVAKPGMASKLAKMFQEMLAQPGMSGKSRIMTDMTGSFNKVVVETDYSDLASYERDMQEFMKQMGTKPEVPKPGHVDLYIEGNREIFRVW